MSSPDVATALPAFLTLNGRVPAAVRDPLLEADRCLEMGLLIGATGCAHRAIRALLVTEAAGSSDRDAGLRTISEKWPSVPQALFTIFRHLADEVDDPQKGMDTGRLTLFTVTLKAIAHEIYVLGPERMECLTYVRNLAESVSRSEAASGGASQSAPPRSASTATTAGSAPPPAA